MKKLSPKMKKLVIIGIVLVVLYLVYYFLNKKSGSSATATTIADATAGLSEDEMKYLTPGTSLSGSNTANEALILQLRYQGMSKDAILADYIENSFKTSSSAMEFYQGKADESGKSLDVVLKENAEYLLWNFKVAGF